MTKSLSRSPLLVVLVLIACQRRGQHTESGSVVEKPGVQMQPPGSPSPVVPPSNVPTSGEPLTPCALVAASATLLGRDVVVDVRDTLERPAAATPGARPEYGYYRLVARDCNNLTIVPSSFQLADANRYRQQFATELHAPLRIHGTLLVDAELSTRSTQAYVLRVASYESLPSTAPRRLTLAEFQQNPQRWDRVTVQYEGVLVKGFEHEILDEIFWVTTTVGATITGTPVEQVRGRSRNRVRVTAIVHSDPGHRYGHMGSAQAELVASQMEYLGAAP
jgi:hypothetical protein